MFVSIVRKKGKSIEKAGHTGNEVKTRLVVSAVTVLELDSLGTGSKGEELVA